MVQRSVLQARRRLLRKNHYSLQPWHSIKSTTPVRPRPVEFRRSEQGLKIEKKRRLAEEQEERDNELRKIGLFFDREAGMYMRD